MDRTIYVCTQCNGPRSRWSQSLCQSCHNFKKNPECSHHWIYDAPNGPTSTGVCKLCGQRGKGANSITQEFGMPLAKGAKKEKEPEQNAIRAGRVKYDADSRRSATR